MLEFFMQSNSAVLPIFEALLDHPFKVIKAFRNNKKEYENQEEAIETLKKLNNLKDDISRKKINMTDDDKELFDMNKETLHKIRDKIDDLNMPVIESILEAAETADFKVRSKIVSILARCKLNEDTLKELIGIAEERNPDKIGIDEINEFIKNKTP